MQIGNAIHCRTCHAPLMKTCCRERNVSEKKLLQEKEQSLRLLSSLIKNIHYEVYRTSEEQKNTGEEQRGKGTVEAWLKCWKCFKRRIGNICEIS